MDASMRASFIFCYFLASARACSCLRETNYAWEQKLFYVKINCFFISLINEYSTLDYLWTLNLLASGQVHWYSQCVTCGITCRREACCYFTLTPCIALQRLNSRDLLLPVHYFLFKWMCWIGSLQRFSRKSSHWKCLNKEFFQLCKSSIIIIPPHPLEQKYSRGIDFTGASIFWR